MNQEEEKIQFIAEQWLEIFERQMTIFLDSYYGKPYTLDKRIKSVDKIRMKQRFLSEKKGYLVPLKEISDIVGLRISVESEKDVEIVSKIIKEEALPRKIIDYFNKPKDTGFKAYLYYFENFEVSTEVQIMTEKMKEWTNATHDEYNHRKYLR